MMRIMIASDLHGSSYYTKLLLQKYKEEKADRLLLLGDLLYHGPRNDLPKDYQPKEVIELLNSFQNDIYCVRGNCDAEVDQMVLQFPILADYAIIPIGKRIIFATHGHIYHKENLPPLHKGDILLYGHTHVPLCEEADHIIYMNPGSVSIPKENSHHGYMLLEDSVFLWKDFAGNIIKHYYLQE